MGLRTEAAAGEVSVRSHRAMGPLQEEVLRAVVDTQGCMEIPSGSLVGGKSFRVEGRG